MSTNQNEEMKINITEYNSFSSSLEEYKFKVVVVGDSGVGKTNLIHRFINNSFQMNTKATVGVEFMSKSFVINECVFKLEVWDTAGQERYKAITSAYYKGANGALVVYDKTRSNTFQNVDKWIGELKERGNQNICLILIGNKSDLKNQDEVNSEESLNKEKILEVPILETSALNASNVKEAFHVLLEEMYKVFINDKKKHKGNEVDDDINDQLGIDLHLTPPKKKMCC